MLPCKLEQLVYGGHAGFDAGKIKGRFRAGRWMKIAGEDAKKRSKLGDARCTPRASQAARTSLGGNRGS
jgi:hypothetical protein